jgi:hypothetical protein
MKKQPDVNTQKRIKPSYSSLLTALRREKFYSDPAIDNSTIIVFLAQKVTGSFRSLTLESSVDILKKYFREISPENDRTLWDALEKLLDISVIEQEQ